LPRQLIFQRTTVPSVEREKYFERLRASKAHYTQANCRFWAFEESALPGAFVEFIEADDETSLSSAHASAPHRVLDPSRIYYEVEIT